MVRDLGVDVQTSTELGSAADLHAAVEDYDAVVLATGLGQVPGLGIPGEMHVVDGLDYIAEAKLGQSPRTLPDRSSSLARAIPRSTRQRSPRAAGRSRPSSTAAPLLR